MAKPFLVLCGAIARAGEPVGSPETPVLLSCVCVLGVRPSLRSELHDALVGLPALLLRWEQTLHGFMGVDPHEEGGGGCWAVNSGGTVSSCTKVSLRSGEWFVLVLRKSAGSVLLVKP